ncbi:Sec-independent protein translocase subunit TatA/TatB [Paramuribaculum intestinale]|uniref:Sec-independent protein translocase subunit TatA/TatB n=1 Tax=Paramuribaculum intestinale TaxID=2094151 RepID=UPI0025A969C5|nr:twin-arginine translocase TatA/TatE family subunit [Paramuribaculum intestinale]
MIPAFFNIGTGEVIVLVFLVLLLFGGKKIPELMRGIGKGVRNFRQGMNDISGEINSAAGKDSTADSDK